MLLELDACNTRIKWRLRQGADVIAAGVDFAKALAGQDFSAVNNVFLSAVNEQWPAEVEAFLQGRNVRRAVTQAQTGTMICAYEDYSRLGIDRWLAMLAAWMQQQNCGHIVVDAGTAITLDIIDAQGRHLGGYIVPGLEMQKKALLQNTRKIQTAADWQTGITSPGANTQQCVEHGILAMCIAWLDNTAAQYPDFCYWLSGGSAQLIMPVSQTAWRHAPDLVLDGLTHYFDLNR